MILYHILPLSIYQTWINSKSPSLHAWATQPEEEDSWSWHEAYQWMAGQMRTRGIHPPQEGIGFWWAWKQWTYDRPKPDLRSRCLKHWGEGPTQRHVMLTLDKPDHEVLLSDYDAWHFPLNYWYLGDRAKEAAQTVRQWEKEGLDYYRQKPLLSPMHDRAMRDSWQPIFALDKAPRRLGYSKKEQSVQATFWELRRQDILEAVAFGGGQLRARLSAPDPIAGA